MGFTTEQSQLSSRLLCGSSLPPADGRLHWFLRPTQLSALPTPICITLMGTSDSFVLLCIYLSDYFFFEGILPSYVPSPGNCCICLCSEHSHSHDALLEVAAEGVGLVVLDFAVLHRASSQVVVQLCGIDGCTALLILGGVLPDPKVDVLGKTTAHSPGLGCGQRGKVRSQLTPAVLLTSLVWEGPRVPSPTSYTVEPGTQQPFFICTWVQRAGITHLQACRSFHSPSSFPHWGCLTACF